ncbi:MAG: Uma2 family endonuclease [Bryobacteraceae bacterium]
MAIDIGAPAAEGVYLDDSRYEMLNGQLLERALPGLQHAKIQAAIKDLLTPFTKRLGGEVAQEWTIVHDKDWLTPDVTFSHRDYKIDRVGRLIAPAYLCVEIRSPEQPIRHLFEKSGIYRKWGIPYCWIIDPIEKVSYQCDAAAAANESIVIKTDVLEAGNLSIKEPWF